MLPELILTNWCCEDVFLFTSVVDFSTILVKGASLVKSVERLVELWSGKEESGTYFIFQYYKYMLKKYYFYYPSALILNFDFKKKWKYFTINFVYASHCRVALLVHGTFAFQNTSSTISRIRTYMGAIWSESSVWAICKAF